MFPFSFYKKQAENLIKEEREIIEKNKMSQKEVNLHEAIFGIETLLEHNLVIPEDGSVARMEHITVFDITRLKLAVDCLKEALYEFEESKKNSQNSEV